MQRNPRKSEIVVTLVVGVGHMVGHSINNILLLRLGGRFMNLQYIIML